jgi:hypothetical protein
MQDIKFRHASHGNLHSREMCSTKWISIASTRIHPCAQSSLMRKGYIEDSIPGAEMMTLHAERYSPVSTAVPKFANITLTPCPISCNLL